MIQKSKQAKADPTQVASCQAQAGLLANALLHAAWYTFSCAMRGFQAITPVDFLKTYNSFVLSFSFRQGY
jgi:hypothetical protein